MNLVLVAALACLTLLSGCAAPYATRAARAEAKELCRETAGVRIVQPGKWPVDEKTRRRVSCPLNEADFGYACYGYGDSGVYSVEQRYPLPSRGDARLWETVQIFKNQGDGSPVAVRKTYSGWGESALINDSGRVTFACTPKETARVRPMD